MNYNEYHHFFRSILNGSFTGCPYEDPEYVTYVKLNQARMRRWDRTLEIPGSLLDRLKKIDHRQHWIIITEPWCSEASHVVPFLIKMAAESELISYDLQLRDSEPFLISSYLTNGTKGIPKLIVRDENNKDLFTWGPRPGQAQVYRDNLSAANIEADGIKHALQHWYNNDRGQSLTTEILQHYA